MGQVPGWRAPDGAPAPPRKPVLTGGNVFAFAVTALTGLGVGLLWVALMAEVESWEEMNEPMLAWTVASIVAGAAPGLVLGLLRRPLLLLAWLTAAVTGVLIAAQLDASTAGGEAGVYLVILCSMILLAPACVGFALGWAVARARADRSPWPIIAAIAVVAILLVPGLDPAWRLAGLGVVVAIGLQRRSRSRPS